MELNTFTKFITTLKVDEKKLEKLTKKWKLSVREREWLWWLIRKR